MATAIPLVSALLLIIAFASVVVLRWVWLYMALLAQRTDDHADVHKDTWKCCTDLHRVALHQLRRQWLPHCTICFWALCILRCHTTQNFSHTLESSELDSGQVWCPAYKGSHVTLLPNYPTDPVHSTELMIILTWTWTVTYWTRTNLLTWYTLLTQYNFGLDVVYWLDVIYWPAVPYPPDITSWAGDLIQCEPAGQNCCCCSRHTLQPTLLSITPAMSVLLVLIGRGCCCCSRHTLQPMLLGCGCSSSGTHTSQTTGRWFYIM